MPIATRDGAGSGRTPAREAILDAARSLFATHGIRGTTVRAIAKSSGLSNTLLYYYFPRKDDLLEALLEVPAKVPPPVPAAWTAEAYDEALAYIEKSFFSWTEPGDFLRMLIIECYAGNQRCIGVSSAELSAFVDALEPALSVACGRIEARDRALSMGYSLSGLLWQAVMHHGKHFQERLASASGKERVRNTIKLLLPLPPASLGAA